MAAETKRQVYGVYLRRWLPVQGLENTVCVIGLRPGAGRLSGSLGRGAEEGGCREDERAALGFDRAPPGDGARSDGHFPFLTGRRHRLAPSVGGQGRRFSRRAPYVLKLGVAGG